MTLNKQRIECVYIVCEWVERKFVAYDLDDAIMYAKTLRLERTKKIKKMGHWMARTYPKKRWVRGKHD